MPGADEHLNQIQLVFSSKQLTEHNHGVVPAVLLEEGGHATRVPVDNILVFPRD